MNKYCIRTYCHARLVDFRSSLKQTSYDDAKDEFLCNDEVTEPIYDFDEFVKANFGHKKMPASPDAIFVGQKKLYFIEFKNQHPSDIDTARMKNKFVNGTEVLKSLLSHFNPRDIQFIFCVVYRRRTLSNSHLISNHIEGRVKDFGLKAKNTELGNFYDEIITQPVDFYVENFAEISCD